MSTEICNRFRNFVTKKLDIHEIRTEIKKTWNIINSILNSGKEKNKQKARKNCLQW